MIGAMPSKRSEEDRRRVPGTGLPSHVVAVSELLDSALRSTWSCWPEQVTVPSQAAVTRAVDGRIVCAVLCLYTSARQGRGGACRCAEPAIPGTWSALPESHQH
jgi:hypothetical protein